MAIQSEGIHFKVKFKSLNFVQELLCDFVGRINGQDVADGGTASFRPFRLPLHWKLCIEYSYCHLLNYVISIMIIIINYDFYKFNKNRK